MRGKQALAMAWRHPKPQGAQGRCIGGGTDLPVDRRKAKRLAHRIRRQARLNAWPHIIHTSPLRRCALVGRILKGWGWRHHVDPALLEMNFGAWDGQAWSAIPLHEVDAWCADFCDHRPGGVESLSEVFGRVTAWWAAQGPWPLLIVGHGGWMLAARWLAAHQTRPASADQWPAPPAYGQGWPLSPPQRAQ